MNAHSLSYNPQVREYAHSGSSQPWHFLTQALAWRFPSHADAARMGPRSRTGGI